MLSPRVSGWFYLLASFPVSCAFAQPTKTEIETLRESINQMQQKLQSLESTEPSSRPRVTDLGPQMGRVEYAVRPIMVLRFYDLSDVFGAAPKYYARRPDDFGADGGSALFPFDYSFQAGGVMGGGGFGGGGGQGGGQFSVPSGWANDSQPVAGSPQSVSPAATVTLDSIIEVIESVIEGGEFGKEKRTIEQVGNGLLVNAPEQVHRQIEDLFDLFRHKWGSLRTVGVEAYWIRSDAKAVHDLLNDPACKTAQQAFGVGVVADSSWKTFFEQAAAEDRIQYSTALSLHNGQTAFSLSGARPVYVNMATPDVYEATNASHFPLVAYQIGVTQLQLGSLLQVTASASRGGHFVMLDVHNRINELLPPTAVGAAASGTSEPLPSTETGPAVSGWAGPIDLDSKADSTHPVPVVQMPPALTPRELAAAIDRPDYETYQLSTTVRCPKDRFVMIGGMAGVGGDRQPKYLFLFAKVSVYDIVLDEVAAAESGTGQ